MRMREAPAESGNTQEIPAPVMSVGPRYRELAGLRVNRVWPTARRRLVGPFVFLDHLLPMVLEPGRGLDVPPHPHIGLATVTYLFDGELVHRDSIGFEQAIRPGQLNWMTAGRGIVHSERSSETARQGVSRLHGLQAWVALPTELEFSDPSFAHYREDQLPRVSDRGADLKLLAGRAFGSTSPVATSSRLFFATAKLEAGGILELGRELGQRAAYIVDGAVVVGSSSYSAGRLLVFDDRFDVILAASERCHLVLLGGDPLPEDRFIWWNFVASSEAAIEAAKLAWRNGRFPSVSGDAGSMPMPD